MGKDTRMNKTQSIITEYMNLCLVCGSPNVEVHHVIHGTANRKYADADGLVVPLCPEHHRGNNGVHGHNNAFDVALEIIGQIAWERKKIADTGMDIEEVRKEFRKRYGQSWI